MLVIGKGYILHYMYRHNVHVTVDIAFDRHNCLMSVKQLSRYMYANSFLCNLIEEVDSSVHLNNQPFVSMYILQYLSLLSFL